MVLQVSDSVCDFDRHSPGYFKLEQIHSFQVCAKRRHISVEVQQLQDTPLVTRSTRRRRRRKTRVRENRASSGLVRECRVEERVQLAAVCSSLAHHRLKRLKLFRVPHCLQCLIILVRLALSLPYLPKPISLSCSTGVAGTVLLLPYLAGQTRQSVSRSVR